MHSVGFVDPDDMNVVSGRRKYSSVVGYSSSKLSPGEHTVIVFTSATFFFVSNLRIFRNGDLISGSLYFPDYV